MSLRREKDTRKKDNVLSVTLKRPILTGMMLAVGFGIGTMLVSLLGPASILGITYLYKYILSLIGG
jgi:hypothetical protein